MNVQPVREIHNADAWRGPRFYGALIAAESMPRATQVEREPFPVA
jgi:hypothetical protein